MAETPSTEGTADREPRYHVRVGMLLTSYTVRDQATGQEYGCDVTMARCSCRPGYLDPNKGAWCPHLRVAWVHHQAWYVAMSREWPQTPADPWPPLRDDPDQQTDRKREEPWH